MKLPPGYSHQTRIGAGAYSTVYRAWQRSLDRYVACKLIPTGRAGGAVAVEKEARMLASLHLPCVPAIYDIRRSGGRVTIVMEWIGGVPLSALADYRIGAGTRLHIAGGLVQALSRLHTAGVVHRDLKPANVIATSDRGVVLVDFGFSNTERTITAAARNAVQGTPAFMAPELWSGDSGPVDYKKADLYSLGMLLKELLGEDMPEAVAPLLATDPEFRSSDGAAFERVWNAMIQPAASREVTSELLEATAEYTARLLFAGARELHARHRTQEAYTLLTESLEAWPDNVEALDFLQSRFSRPRPEGGGRRTLLWGAGACVVTAAIAGAFVAGKHSSMPRGGAGEQLLFDDIERRGRGLPVLSGEHRGRDRERVELRDVAVTGGLSGSVTVVVPDARGTLTIDGNPVAPDEGCSFTATLADGRHRIEWFDPIRRRSGGETVDVLPFCSKTISLQRFTDE